MNIMEPNSNTLGSLLENTPDKKLLKKLLKKNKKSENNFTIEPILGQKPNNGK